MRRSWLLASLATIAVATCGAAIAAAAAGSGEPRPGEARLVLDGRALVGDARGGSEVRHDQVVRRGDHIRILEGTARLELGSGPVLRLRRGSHMAFDQSPSLAAGEMLVDARRQPITVRAAGSEVEVVGVARISRSLALTVSSYRGSVHLSSAGRTLDVAVLRRATVPAIGQVPLRSEPLVYDRTDPWDRLFLGLVMELTDELDARSAGFSAQLAQTPATSPVFWKLIFPSLERESLLGPGTAYQRSPGETLVATGIALASRPGPYASRLERSLTFRDEGATWGMVAVEFGVTDPAALLDLLDTAVSRSPVIFAARPATAALASATPSVAGARPTPPRPVPSAAPGAPAAGPTAPPAPGPASAVPPVAPPSPAIGDDGPSTGTEADPLTETVVDTLTGVVDPLV